MNWPKIIEYSWRNWHTDPINDETKQVSKKNDYKHTNYKTVVFSCCFFISKCISELIIKKFHKCQTPKSKFWFFCWGKDLFRKQAHRYHNDRKNDERKRYVCNRSKDCFSLNFWDMKCRSMRVRRYFCVYLSFIVWALFFWVITCHFFAINCVFPASVALICSTK